MKKFRFISLALSILMVLTLFAGCGSSDTSSSDTEETEETEEAATEETAAEEEEEEEEVTLSGTLSTNGSTSMESVVASLIEAFTEKYPDVTITYDPTGSGSGITAATEGTTDIGLSSRKLKESETGLNATVIALDGIAIIVNTANTVEDLTLEQIAGLVTGEYTSWADVGGEDQPVTVIGREAGSGTRDGFESIVGVEDECVYDQELTSTGAVIAAVAANEYAIGYASLSAVGDTVKTVSVEGVMPSEDTVLDGTYAIQRPFVMVTNASESNELAEAFIAYALSDEATEIIANAGAVQATGTEEAYATSTAAEETAAAEEEAEEEVALSGTLSTNGSTSMESVVASLIEAFTEKYPDVTITYDPTGSGSGITAATEGTTDIGLSSRNLKDTETGLDATVIAYDGIAIIVNTANTVEDLTIEQIAGLVTGEITNWSEVGGPDQPVTVIGREAGSGTRDGFESIVGVEDECVYDQELTSTGAVIAAVAANEYAIGYASLSAVGDTVKTVSVEGVTPSEDTVLDGTYQIQRPFVMVTKTGVENELAQAFIDYALSDEATEIIANAGAVQAQ